MIDNIEISKGKIPLDHIEFELIEKPKDCLIPSHREFKNFRQLDDYLVDLVLKCKSMVGNKNYYMRGISARFYFHYADGTIAKSKLNDLSSLEELMHENPFQYRAKTIGIERAIYQHHRGYVKKLEDERLEIISKLPNEKTVSDYHLLQGIGGEIEKISFFIKNYDLGAVL